MNARIAKILRISENPTSLYAAKRIEELEAENQRLRDLLTQAKEELENIIGYPTAEKLPFYDGIVDALKEATP